MTIKRIAAIVIVLGILGGGYYYWRQSAAAKQKATEPEIETAKVERKDLLVTVSASGVIEPLTTVEVKSRSGGEIKKIFVEAGDVVRPHQLIAQIDPTQTKSKVAQASATVAGGKAQLAKARLDAALQQARASTDISKSVAAVEAARANVAQIAEQLQQDEETIRQTIRQAEASLRAARARYAQAEAQAQAQPALQSAQVESARAALEAAKQNLARLQTGPRPQEIAQAEASLRNAEAALRNAEATLKRQQALWEKGFVARQAVDDAQKAFEQALAQKDMAAESLALLRAGSRAEDIAQAQAQVAQAEAALRQAEANAVQIALREQEKEAAREALAEAEAALAAAQARKRDVQVRRKQLEAAQAAVKQAEAALEAAQAEKLQTASAQQNVRVALADLRKQTLQLNEAMTDLGYTNIYAPRGGVIMQKLVEEGTVIPAGTAALKEGAGLVTIADTSQMFVLAEVDESDMAGVRVGQKAEIMASVLPEQKLPGRVVKIFPQGQEEQNVVRFKVRVRIDNPPPQLRPGMTADVTIFVAQRKKVLVVPDVAITRSKGKATVEVQIAPGQVETREVKPGLSNWEETEIIAGLKEGETVIVPPPPGSEPPPWMGGGKQRQQERTRRHMLMQFRK